MNIKKDNKFPITWGGALLLLLTSLAPLGLVGTFLCTLIPPSKLWISGILGPSFSFLVITCFAIGVFYLCFRKKRSLLFFLAILLNFTNISHGVAFNSMESVVSNTATADTNKGRKIKVVSYNVCLFGYYCESRKEALSNKDSILSFLKDANADILCLQEFYESKSDIFVVTKILEQSGYKYHTKPRENSKFYFGNIIFSKFPIINQDTIQQLSPLYALYADLLLSPTDTLRVYSMHLESLKFDNKDKHFYSSLLSNSLNENTTYKEGVTRIATKIGSAAKTHESQVKKIRKDILLSPYPAILCGDMNENPISYSYTYLKKVLKDSFLEKGRGIGQTYKGLFPSFRIDYIFYKNISEHSWKLQTSEFTIAHKNYSDHKPICVTFSIQ